MCLNLISIKQCCFSDNSALHMHTDTIVCFSTCSVINYMYSRQEASCQIQLCTHLQSILPPIHASLRVLQNEKLLSSCMQKTITAIYRLLKKFHRRSSILPFLLNTISHILSLGCMVNPLTYCDAKCLLCESLTHSPNYGLYFK